MASLPVVGPSPGGSTGPVPKPPKPVPEGPTSRAPAALLGPEPSPPAPSQGPSPGDLFNDINGLADSSSPPQTGNGAPTGPVTGALHPGGRSAPSARKTKQVPVKKREKSKVRIPSAKDLFG